MLSSIFNDDNAGANNATVAQSANKINGVSNNNNNNNGSNGNGNGTPPFSLSVPMKFKYDNSYSAKQLVRQCSSFLQKDENLDTIVKILDEHWVENVADIRLLAQENMLRDIGIPTRLCILIERMISAIDEAAGIGRGSAGNLDIGDMKLDEKDDDAGIGFRPNDPAPAVPSKKEIKFVHESDFDTNGLMYYLGTKGHTQPWKNPAELGIVKVTISSLGSDSQPASAAVGRLTVRCVTQALKDSWFLFEIPEPFTATHYSLRHYSSWDTEALRNWRLEGSLDGLNFVTLREHIADPALSTKGSTATWDIKTPTPCRFYRLFQFGVNSNGHYYLPCSGFELYGTLVANAASQSAVPAIAEVKAYAQPSVVVLREQYFKYVYDFDTNGILHALGTDFGKREWQNPALIGAVEIKSSTVAADSQPITAMVGKETVRCVTQPLPNSWFLVDFLDKRVSPTNYSLRHYLTFDTEAIRNWRFEASNDGINFVVLREHVNDTALNRKGGTFTWSVNNPKNDFYRYFRIFQTGVNSNNHHYLAISGFELYGFAKIAGAPPAAVAAPVVAPAPAIAPAAAAVDAGAAMKWDDAFNPSISVTNNGLDFINNGTNDKWQAIRSVNRFDSGVQTFSVKVLADTPTSNQWSMIVGVVPASFKHTQNNWLGSQGSWGYISGTGGKCHQVGKSLPYGKTWANGDVITVQIDFTSKTLQFAKNGESQGIAFYNIEGPVHAAMSLTAQNARIGFVDAAIPQMPALGVGQDLTWDSNKKGEFLVIDPNTNTVTNSGSNSKWQTARSSQSFSKGQVQFSIEICTDPVTTNFWKFIVGVCPTGFEFNERKQWLGSQGSWGYIGGTGGKCYNVGRSTNYGQPFTSGDVITVKLDFDKSTIEFLKNGVSQGIAFGNLQGPVHAAASLTGTSAAVRFRRN